MKDNVIEINALPSLLSSLFATTMVRLSEIDGGVHVMPINDERSLDGLIGILADYPEMSVDNFLMRMRADKELEQ